MQGMNRSAKGVLSAALAAVGLGLSATASALDVTVYANDYDSPATVAGGITATGLTNGSLGTVAGGPYAGLAGKSWAGSFFQNQSTGNPATGSTLTLTGLPTHTGVHIDFLLGLLNSWDSRNGGCCSPDNVDLYIDGTAVAHYTYNTALGTIKDIGGGTLLVEYGQIDTNFFYSDVLADMSTEGVLTFAHSASSLTLMLQASGAGWQGGGDEYWGVDDLSVTLTGVVRTPPTNQTPEPAMLGLLGLAAILGGAARRRARLQA
ncbi:MAG: PEP-CTERM sorting domain-containing protein [Rhodocyclaceae bacterium]|nr:PEP-CTERM sorting domain-containing protein [Rhodocyclaceae bacterium]MBX3667256.1 PEP-CTERM sorting domain-containing protein [Rhodocyclaceae bacterium]